MSSNGLEKNELFIDTLGGRTYQQQTNKHYNYISLKLAENICQTGKTDADNDV